MNNDENNVSSHYKSQKSQSINSSFHSETPDSPNNNCDFYTPKKKSNKRVNKIKAWCGDCYQFFENGPFSKNCKDHFLKKNCNLYGCNKLSNEYKCVRKFPNINSENRHTYCISENEIQNWDSSLQIQYCLGIKRQNNSSISSTIQGGSEEKLTLNNKELCTTTNEENINDDYSEYSSYFEKSRKKTSFNKEFVFKVFPKSKLKIIKNESFQLNNLLNKAEMDDENQLLNINKTSPIEVAERLNKQTLEGSYNNQCNNHETMSNFNRIINNPTNGNANFEYTNFNNFAVPKTILAYKCKNEINFQSCQTQTNDGNDKSFNKMNNFDMGNNSFTNKNENFKHITLDKLFEKNLNSKQLEFNYNTQEVNDNINLNFSENGRDDEFLGLELFNLSNNTNNVDNKMDNSCEISKLNEEDKNLEKIGNDFLLLMRNDKDNSIKLNSSLDYIQNNVMKLSEQISKLKFIEKNNVSNTLIEETENLINEFKKLTANSNNSLRTFIDKEHTKKHLDFRSADSILDDLERNYTSQSVQTEYEVSQVNNGTNNKEVSVSTNENIEKCCCNYNYRYKDDCLIDDLFEKVHEVSKVPKSIIKKIKIAFKKKGFYTVMSLRLRKKNKLNWNFLLDDFKDVCSQIVGISLVIENLLEQIE